MQLQPLPAPYDIVGRYNQDEINGFGKPLIDRLLEICKLEEANHILDAMAGDGNLTYNLFKFCEERRLSLPRVTVLEFSQVQSEIAAVNLSPYPASVIWGDILEMRALHDNRPIQRQAFERVIIKSANHEIPLSLQQRLYRNIYDALRPDGLFINLGFLFDEEEERNELREIARVKDELAGLEMAVRNRHFLTRTEFYDRLRGAGFVDIQTAHSFLYRIRSEIVAKRYFRTEVIERDDMEFQMAQLKAKTMRQKGRIRFEADASIMECPGEVTIVRRPTLIEENQAIYQRYPYDFLRHIKAHRDMLSAAAQYVAPGAHVMDAGCGIGLMAERVAERAGRYLAVDANASFVDICRRRLRALSHVEVMVADLNDFRIDAGSFDTILALNVLYQEDIKPEQVLEMFHDALRLGGTLVVTAPRGQKSFEQCEGQLLADLDREGALSGKEEIARQIRAANEKLLSSKGHYWSGSEMAMLLKRIGFREIKQIDDSLYHGAAWLVAAER